MPYTSGHVIEEMNRCLQRAVKTIGRLLPLLVLPFAASSFAAQGVPASWIDRPLVGWNKAGASIPGAPMATDTKAAVISRCKLSPRRSTKAEQTIDAAGWIAFWNVDQQLVRDDVEIVGGMRSADASCEPANYNLFVFVGGAF